MNQSLATRGAGVSVCAAALCCLLVAPERPVLSQTQQKPDISVDVKLVNVLATVRNKKGEIVKRSSIFHKSPTFR
jgi:hypothetical protein